MTHSPPAIRRLSQRRPVCGLLAWLTCLAPALASAQPDSRPAEHPGWEARIAATEHTLWLALIHGSRSTVFFREAGGRFDSGRATEHRIAAMTALEQALLVFFEDDAPYRYFADAGPPSVEGVLPQGATPLDVAGERGRLCAIIGSAAARELPIAGADDLEPTSQPFDPGDAPLTLAVYDGRSWRAVIALPSHVPPGTDWRTRPRLCLSHDRLWLFALTTHLDQIEPRYHDAESSTWVVCEPIPVGSVTGFWVVNFSRIPTVVTSSPDPAVGEKISALRLLGDAVEDGASAWQPADLQFSELPDGVTVARYNDVVGFNQHLGLLAIGTNRQAYLQFARIAEPPVEATFRPADLLAGPGLAARTQSVFQILTFVVLLAVLAGLFVFRRASLVKPIELPSGYAPAFNLQRLLGWLIDFVPFAWIGAIVHDVSGTEGLRTLAAWAISPARGEDLPGRSILSWWAFSVVCHTTYALIMELILRRTPGKYFARVHLLSESGVWPSVWQILARNLTRLVELTPQFWVFGVLVLLSRNHQRLGDIFARTVVVRPVPARPDATNGGRTRLSDEEPSDTARDDDARPDSGESESAEEAETSEKRDDLSPDGDSDDRRSSGTGDKE